MVSTLLDIETSVRQEVAVPVTWVLPDYRNSSTSSLKPYVIEAYFVQCSLSAVTTEAVLDMQANSLLNPVPMSQPSTQWEIMQWSQWASDSWQAWINTALATNVGSGYSFVNYSMGSSPTGTEPSIVDELKPSLRWYIMTLVGLDLTNETYAVTSPLPTVVLSPGKLEAAIAQVAAQLIWTGKWSYEAVAFASILLIVLHHKRGEWGHPVEDFNTGVLNINLLPLLFATSASVIMMILVLSMTRAFDASSDSQAAIPNTGVLQLMWLGRHSAPVNEILDDVEHPMEANLCRAGMIDVRFAKTISDESELGGFN